MLERTPRAAENPWRWFRQDPDMAQAMQSVLVTGQGGDIIAAMRAMNPQAVLETVAIAYGDLCDESLRAYNASRQRAEQWSLFQLLLGIMTVLVIAGSIAAIFFGLAVAAASTAAVSLVTGSAGVWFDRKVEENRREADARFQDMVRYCAQSKLIMQLSPTLHGLDAEQQERVVSSILSLRL